MEKKCEMALELALQALMEGVEEETTVYQGKTEEIVYQYLMDHMKDLENIACRKVKVDIEYLDNSVYII